MKFLGRFRCVLVAVLIFLMSFPSCSAASGLDSENNSLNYGLNKSSYEMYDIEYKDVNCPDNIIELDFESAVFSSDAEIKMADFEGKENCLVWENGQGKATFKVDLPQESRYAIKLEYYSVAGKGTALEYAI